MGIKLGNIDISSFKVGAADCSIYLGTTKLYPQGEPPTPPVFEGKYKLTLSDSSIVSGDCTLNTVVGENDIKAYSATTVEAEIGTCATEIGVQAFFGFTNLEKVTIPNTITRINLNAFNQCSGLTSVDIPDSVTIISNATFTGCKSLSSATLSNNITIIGVGVFKDCRNLGGIEIPSGVTEIGVDAFKECWSLSSITIPDAVTKIGSEAFYNCTGLTTVTIGSGITEIGSGAFEYSNNITSLTIYATTPPTISRYTYTFTGSYLIYVPCESVSAYQTAWPDYASRITCIPTTKFTITKYNGNTVDLSKDCDGSSVLSSREFDNTILPSPYYANYINIIEVGDCVESIENTCFNSSYLEQITLPSTLTSIGSSCFYNCPQLTSITCLAATPPTLGSYALTNSNNVQIYVPASAVDTYKAASGWSTYASRIQAIP